MKKLLVVLVLLFMVFALMSCTQEEQKQAIDDVLDNVVSTENATVIITAMTPIFEDNSVRNGNIYESRISGNLIAEFKLQSSGVIEILFTDGSYIMIKDYISLEVIVS